MTYSALAIPLNKNVTKLNALSDERQDTFIKTYYQLCLLVRNEVYLVNNIMLSFNDRRPRPQWIYGWIRCNNDYWLLSNTPYSSFMDFQTNNQHFEYYSIKLLVRICTMLWIIKSDVTIWYKFY